MNAYFIIQAWHTYLPSAPFSRLFEFEQYLLGCLVGQRKSKSPVVTTSSPHSPEVLTASTVTAPVSSVHHHHYADVTGQDGDSQKRRKGKTRKRKEEFLFCNFPNHEGLVSCFLCVCVFPASLNCSLLLCLEVWYRHSVERRRTELVQN